MRKAGLARRIIVVLDLDALVELRRGATTSESPPWEDRDPMSELALDRQDR
jgi:hypothetical protein